MGQILCAFVFGKARVTLLKSITMARLELVDAVVSVIVREQLRKELSFSEIEKTFWKDSQVVPSYLANEHRKFHIFLANINRVQELREKTSAKPANEASRDLHARNLKESKWIRGAHILY